MGQKLLTPIRKLADVPDPRPRQLKKHEGKRGMPFYLAAHRNPDLTHAERMHYRREAALKR